MSEQFDNWEDVRSAYHVARLGTLSAAAAFLGVHHATLIRRIDGLEARLGTKLFQRHPRGYTPTEAGEDLKAVAALVEDRLAQLAARIQGQGAGLTGELILTSLSGLSPWLTPVLAGFQAEYPDVRLSVIMDERLLRLEYGEAHVALRAGPKPQEPDNVVRELGQFPVTLFAAQTYLDRHGPLKSLSELQGHRFVGAVGPMMRAPTFVWMAAHVQSENIVYRTSDMRAIDDAVVNGIGLGFLSEPAGKAAGLIPMCLPQPEWTSTLWLVAHRDMVRSARVQALLEYLRRYLN